MRISTVWMQQRALNDILDRQARVSDTQLHLSSGKRILDASDDPVAAAQVLNLQHVEAANQQYLRNIDSANNQLGLESSALDQTTTLLQRVRTLALQGTNGSQTETDRQASAAELNQLFSQLLQLANGRDAQGDALFGGTANQGAPFVRGDDFSVGYSGDDGQRMVAAAPGMQVATGDPGSRVFMDIPAGNGRFAVTAGATNQGAVVVGASQVVDNSSWTGGDYNVTFTTADQWEARDSLGTLIASGSYSGHGALEFAGIQVQLEGAAQAGDTLAVRAGAAQNVFTTVGKLIDAFENIPPGAASSNIVNRQIEGIDQALQRVGEVRARIGTRVGILENQQAASGDLTVLHKGAISQLQDIDLASAISKLNLQQVALQAAQQTYVRVQGMSLFDYLK